MNESTDSLMANIQTRDLLMFSRRHKLKLFIPLFKQYVWSDLKLYLSGHTEKGNKLKGKMKNNR